MPDRLVQDLEDDRVILFCGAGISMGAGLPDYAGLVEHCFKELSHPYPKEDSGDLGWPDRLLGTLETQFSPEQVRKIVIERLDRKPITLDVHRAILQLSQTRKYEGLRLVTTNFDTYFEKAGKSLRLKYDWHSGPILPIPRNDQAETWRSIVYLHGRLDAGAPHQMVLTSADFGRAYLTESWAARFVARLFSDFTILFIGYSLNDPVLRYMTDAFAAEKYSTRFSQNRGPAYIFVSHTGAASPNPKSFQERNLEPIFYNDSNRHIDLKRTLMTWANWRSDYLSNTTQLINEIAPRRPDAIDPTDTENLLWAVTGRANDQGHGARIFSSVLPRPPIEWLDEFERREQRVRREHFEASELAKRNDQVAPPAPTFDIEMLFPDALDHRDFVLTPIAHGLVSWLSKSLTSIAFVNRVIDKLANGRRLHAELRNAIVRELVVPNALPIGLFRFWWLVTAKDIFFVGEKRPDYMAMGPLASVLQTRQNPDLLRPWLQEALRHTLKISRATSGRANVGLADSGQAAITSFSDVASATIQIANLDAIQHVINAVNAEPDADAFWANFLDDLVVMVQDALQLYSAVGQADVNTDPTYYDRPSIAPHSQNENRHNWTMIFDLIWRAWTYVDRVDQARSKAYVQTWVNKPFLGFRRLAAAAANHSGNFSSQERLEILLNG